MFEEIVDLLDPTMTLDDETLDDNIEVSQLQTPPHVHLFYFIVNSKI